MNKADFIKKITEKLGVDEEKGSAINDIMEDTFVIGKSGKDKIVEKLKEKLNCSDEEANKIYEAAMDILKDGLVSKLKNPFGSQN